MPMHVLFNNRGNLKQPGPTWGVNNPKEKSRRVGGGAISPEWAPNAGMCLIFGNIVKNGVQFVKVRVEKIF
jgi:hypothetical protein